MPRNASTGSSPTDACKKELYGIVSEYLGYLVSTMQGSTDTTFYVLAVYFGAVGVKKTRHAVPAGLLADAAGIAAAVFICHVIWGGLAP